MMERDVMQGRAADLMREALVLLDRLDADLAAVHLQWALDLMRQKSIMTRLRAPKRKIR